MHWSGHAHAPRYLVGLTFAESSFFPVPPDVMLAPMVLAQRERAWYLADTDDGERQCLVAYLAT